MLNFVSSSAYLCARSHSGSASLRRGTEAEMIAARVGSESPEMKVMRQLGSVKVRLKPLGVDRDRRRYWLFALGEVSLLKEPYTKLCA